MTDIQTEVSTGSTTAGAAVRYDKDADGIVVLTIDDPTSSANTMNRLYKESMGAAVDRLEAEIADGDEVAGVVVTSAKKTFFAGGDLKMMVQAGPDDAGTIFAEVEEIKAQLRRLETLGRPVVAAVNGTRARRRSRDRARLPPPDRARRARRTARLPRGHPRAAARRWRGHPHRADARPVERADGRAAPRPAPEAGRGQGEGPRRRAGARPRRAAARGQGLGQRAPRRRGRGHPAVGPGRLQDAGRHAVVTRSSRRSCPRSRPTCASSSRAPTTRPRGRSCPRPSRARRSTSTPPPASSRATWPGWSPGRTPRT